MKISNLTPGENYSRYWKIYTPDNELHWTSAKVSGPWKYRTWSTYKTLHLSSIQTGEWRVELEFDGRLIEQATFEILKP